MGARRLRPAPRRLSACAANVPDTQIQAGGFPQLGSRLVSSPGSSRGANGGRGAGGSVPPAQPTQTNQPGDVRSRLPPRVQGGAFGRAGKRSQAPGRPRGARQGPRRSLSPGRGAPRRGKCGGRAGRLLGTPRAPGTRCSLRRHAHTLRARWGLLRGRQSPGRPPLLGAGAHPDAAPDERSPRTAGPAAPDLSSSEPLPSSVFSPSLRLPPRTRGSSPRQSSLRTRGTPSTRRRWRGERE